ncbi:inorganic pyrophosphatase 2-like [Telopea speciosissima]|uniref:inorganic pyrophosphatase 2-like n=1 Tax=Telopea speciosissima TaxID=54955 RepID=UPI001CC401E9|nr:inorganic pyrophosphatase 2-like [Telopea speciosissima]
MMQEFHSQGITIQQIEEVLKRAPVLPGIVTAIKAAHSLGCELRILSDANVFYIDTILKHLGVMDYFSEINTNPTFVNEEGRLRISPYHDFTSSPHGCNLCPPNMCKSRVMERMQASTFAGGKKRFIYIGDGKGDYCPILKLGEGDRVMPRKNFPLWELICSNPLLIKPQVHEWSDGEDLERVLLHLINMITREENSKTNSAQLIPGDCKLETIPISTHEAFHKSVQVPL